jgi:small multidrug resistance pump
MWSGLGIALISVIGVVLFQQSLDWPAIAGIVLIISGVAVIHLFSKAIAH